MGHCTSRKRDRSPPPPPAPAPLESVFPALVSPLDSTVQRSRARLAPAGRSRPSAFASRIVTSSSLADTHLDLTPMPVQMPVEPVPPAAPPVSILVHRNTDQTDSSQTPTQRPANQTSVQHLSRLTQSLPAQSVAQCASTSATHPAPAVSLPALMETPVEQWKVEQATAWVRTLLSTISPRSIDGVVRCFENARVDGAQLMRIKSAELKELLAGHSPAICGSERESKQLRTELKKQLKALRVRARKLREQNKKLERSSSTRSNTSQVALPMSEQKRSFLPFRRTSSLRKSAGAAAPTAPAVANAAPENSSPAKRHSGSSTSASVADAASAPTESEA